MSSPTGRRERKKAATRQHIADAASELFWRRGFEAVTVDDIAAAADVSRMTVFNHFRRKEEMYFDRADEIVEALATALRDRPPRQSIAAAVQALLVDLTARRHPFSGLRDGVARFYEVVQESPALQAGARDQLARFEERLAVVIRADVGAAPDDPRPAVVAGVLLVGLRTVYLHAARRLLAGERADAIAADQAALIDAVFGTLGDGLAGYGVQPLGQ